MLDKIVDRLVDSMIKTMSWCINAPSFKKVVCRLPVLLFVVSAALALLIPCVIIFSISSLFIADSFFEEFGEDWDEIATAWNKFIEDLGLN